MSAIFVTGSGTEIGKTYITAALIRELRRRGGPVEALKPVVSGFDPEHAAESDPGILLSALAQEPTQAALDRISPWRFRAPLSPDMAARREGRALDFDALVAFTRQRIAAAAGTLLIEGIGGVMVPLDEHHTMRDWIAALEIPALLIAGSYLGALSHALTAIEALRQRKIAIKAVIVNQTPGSGVELEETVATIRRFSPAAPVTGLPRLEGEAGHRALQHIADLL